MNREGLIRKIVTTVEEINYGGPFSRAPGEVNEDELLLSLAREGGAQEAELIVDLVRNPISGEEAAKALTSQGRFASELKQYLGAHLVVNPDQLLDLVNEAASRYSYGERLVIKAFGILPDETPKRYLPALERAWSHSKEDPDVVGSILSALSMCFDEETEEILQRLLAREQEASPDLGARIAATLSGVTQSLHLNIGRTYRIQVDLHL